MRVISLKKRERESYKKILCICMRHVCICLCLNAGGLCHSIGAKVKWQPTTLFETGLFAAQAG